jgi:protein phosphatase
MRATRTHLGSMLAVAARSDTGRKRNHNEDRVATDAARGIALVADGMGGHRGGEVASGLAAETVVNQIAERLETVPPEAAHGADETPAGGLARELVGEANTIVFETARTQPQYEGMGTTLTLALFHNDRLSLAHVGDSRAYRLRAGHLEQITHDHTLLQELVEQEGYKPEQAAASVNANVITRALGTEATVAVDLQEVSVLPGDVYLLCSDGLTDMLADPAISATLQAFSQDLDAAAERLITQANDCGGSDNISLVLVRVAQPDPHRRTGLRRLLDRWLRAGLDMRFRRD